MPVKVTTYPHPTTTVTLTAKTSMNKGIEVMCEGVRVKPM